LTSNKQQAPAARPTGTGGAASPRRLSSAELFVGSDLVVIEHQGAAYQLRITRQGKLILTK